MSTVPQNVAIVMVFLVLGGGVALAVAPYELGTIRLAGVSLLWWYGAVGAPFMTVAVTVAALLYAAFGRKSAAPQGTGSRASPPVPTSE